MEYGQNTASGGYAGDYRDQVVEERPLDEISVFADRIAKACSTLEEHLSRFNGPTPSPLAGATAGAPSPIPCHRTELQRLRRSIDELDILASSISRLG